MPFLTYNDNNLSSNIKDWEEIAEYLKIEIEDEEIWSIARESKEVPLLENIYQNCLLSSIINHFDENKLINLNSFINARDTHLYFENNGWEEITSLEEFIKSIDEKMLLDAQDKVTKDIFNSLEHGEEIELNEVYKLYRYTEDDIFVIIKSEEWEEVLQVLTDGDNFVFEQL